MSISRRELLASTIVFGSIAAERIRAQSLRPTARQIVERIKTAFGPSWRETPTDAFHAGDPDVAVTGIATTVMSTLLVLQHAVAAEKNVVAGLETDALLVRKQEFIKQHNLAVFRFHDNWHARRPEPMGQAFAQFLGWDRRPAGRSHGLSHSHRIGFRGCETGCGETRPIDWIPAGEPFVKRLAF